MDDSKKIKFKSSTLLMQLVVDISAIIVSYAIQLNVRFVSGIFGTPMKIDTVLVITTGILFVLYWIFIFWISGLFKDWYFRSPFDEFYTIIKASFIGSFLLFFFVFLGSSGRPRLLFLFYIISLSFFTAIGRFIIRKLQTILKEKRVISTPVLIIGTHQKVRELKEQIDRKPSWGYTATGALLLDVEEPQDPPNPFDSLTVPKYFGMENFIHAIESSKPDEVFIAASNHKEHTELLEIVSICDERRISVKIEPDLYDFFTGQARTLHLWGMPLIEINTQIMKPWEYFIKRFLDILISSFVIIVGMPIWLLISLVIKIESKGSVFYKQVRIGKNGNQFKIYKFRSMKVDAEKNGPQWAVVNDPRVTKFGRFLRKSHLDEFPQFINVLQGVMSLVGPRPERPYFVEKFTKIVPFYNRRHVIRPGITGWWQVKYTVYIENRDEIESRLKLDFFYIENMSLKLDIEIIIRTIFLVFRGHGQT